MRLYWIQSSLLPHRSVGRGGCSSLKGVVHHISSALAMLVGGVNPSGRVVISPSEREYLTAGVEANLRADGRPQQEWRPVSVELNPVPQAAGSARVRLGGTDVLVSVKGDIGRPTLEQPSHGQIVCLVDSSTVFAMNAVHGGSNEDRLTQARNDELTALLNNVLVHSGVLDAAMFCLVPGKHCWILYVDVLVLDYDGNLLDAMIAAAQLALSAMRLPIVRIEESGEATDVVLAEQIDSARIIPRQSLPLAVTVAKIRNGFVLDPSASEELCSDAALLLAFVHGKLVAMRKLGAGMLDPGLLSEYISTASQASGVLASRLSESLLESVSLSA